MKNIIILLIGGLMLSLTSCEGFLEEDPKGFNPLIHYIPEDSFQDLVFLQSRKSYFCSQEIELIMQFLRYHFENEAPDFLPGEQALAWSWFWETVSRSGE